MDRVYGELCETIEKLVGKFFLYILAVVMAMMNHCPCTENCCYDGFKRKICGDLPDRHDNHIDDNNI